MKNIIDFSCSKVNQISLELDKNTTFSIIVKGSNNYKQQEYLEYTHVGSGSYGDVLKVQNFTSDESIVPKKSSIIAKIMKHVGKGEPDRTKQVKHQIKKIKKNARKLEGLVKRYSKYKSYNDKKKVLQETLKNEKNKIYLISKYILGILDVKKCKSKEIIFLNYLEGFDLKDLVSNQENTFKQSDIDFLFLQVLIGVRIFHKILNFSHRDLKLENLFYDKNEKIVKLIDFGFICFKDDMDCIKKYQGTGKYIHSKQNKILTKKNNRYSASSSKVNSYKNNWTQKKEYNFPKAFPQDLFSLIIIMLKFYYENRNKTGGSNANIFKIIKNYDKNFVKHNDRYRDKKTRYQNKKKLFQNLLKLDISKINHRSLRLIVGVIKDYWSFEKKDFVANGKDENIGKQGETGDKVASGIIDFMIIELSKIVNTSPIGSPSKYFSLEMIKNTLTDISILNSIEN